MWIHKYFSRSSNAKTQSYLERQNYCTLQLKNNAGAMFEEGKLPMWTQLSIVAQRITVKFPDAKKFCFFGINIGSSFLGLLVLL